MGHVASSRVSGNDGESVRVGYFKYLQETGDWEEGESTEEEKIWNKWVFSRRIRASFSLGGRRARTVAGSSKFNSCTVDDAVGLYPSRTLQREHTSETGPYAPVFLFAAVRSHFL